MVELSLGKWLTNKSPYFQSNFGLAMKGLPLLEGLYGWIFCRYALGMDMGLSVLIPALLAITQLGWYMSWDWGHRAGSLKHYGSGITISWAGDIIRDHLVNFTEPRELNPRETGAPITAGPRWHYFETTSTEDVVDPIVNQTFRNWLLISPYDKNETFKKVSGQSISFEGSVFEAPGSRLTLIWAGDWESRGDLADKELVVKFRAFYVFFSPQVFVDVQKKGFKLLPSLPGQKELTEMLNLSDSDKSIKLSLELRDERSLTKHLAQKLERTGDQVAALTGKSMDLDRLLRKEPTMIDWRNRKLQIALLLIGLTVVAFLAYYYGFRTA